MINAVDGFDPNEWLAAWKLESLISFRINEFDEVQNWHFPIESIDINK